MWRIEAKVELTWHDVAKCYVSFRESPVFFLCADTQDLAVRKAEAILRTAFTNDTEVRFTIKATKENISE